MLHEAHVWYSCCQCRRTDSYRQLPTFTECDVDVAIARYRHQQQSPRHVVLAEDLQPSERHLVVDVLLVEVETATNDIPHLH